MCIKGYHQNSKTPYRRGEFANRTADKGLYSEYIKNFCNKTTKIQFKNRQKNWNAHYYKEDMQMDNNHVKRCLTSFAIRECKLKLQWDILYT